jgi:hypothetical protein
VKEWIWCSREYNKSFKRTNNSWLLFVPHTF